MAKKNAGTEEMKGNAGMEEVKAGDYRVYDRSAQQLVNFKLDSVVKESAEATLAAMGLNMSSYLGMCLRQVSQKGALPFTPDTDPAHWATEMEVSEAVAIAQAGLPRGFRKLCLGYLDGCGEALNRLQGIMLTLEVKRMSALAAHQAVIDSSGEDGTKVPGGIAFVESGRLADHARARFDCSLDEVRLDQIEAWIDWGEGADAGWFTYPCGIANATDEKDAAISCLCESAKLIHGMWGRYTDEQYREADGGMWGDKGLAGCAAEARRELEELFPDGFTRCPAADGIYGDLYRQTFSDLADLAGLLPGDDGDLEGRAASAMGQIRAAAETVLDHYDALTARFVPSSSRRGDLDELMQMSADVDGAIEDAIKALKRLSKQIARNDKRWDAARKELRERKKKMAERSSEAADTGKGE